LRILADIVRSALLRNLSQFWASISARVSNLQGRHSQKYQLHGRRKRLKFRG
jgi:hypothetical protein